MPVTTRPFARTFRLAALAAAATVAMVAMSAPHATRRGTARADSSAAPVFSDPTSIDHAFLPVVPGALKVFSGRDEGVAKTVVEHHLRETRSFAWDGGSVECRVVEQRTFEDGVVSSTERLFFAQADDGSVWLFGEVEDSVEDTPSEPGSWVVGSAAQGDPEGTVETSSPALAMPAAPAAGDEWTAESVLGVEKTVLVAADGITVPGPAGRIAGGIRVIERETGDRTPESVWYAPGVGAVREVSRGERMALKASSVGLRR